MDAKTPSTCLRTLKQGMTTLIRVAASTPRLLP
jgi:hypothetical protein